MLEKVERVTEVRLLSELGTIVVYMVTEVLEDGKVIVSQSYNKSFPISDIVKLQELVGESKANALAALL